MLSTSVVVKTSEEVPMALHLYGLAVILLKTSFPCYNVRSLKKAEDDDQEIEGIR